MDTQIFNLSFSKGCQDEEENAPYRGKYIGTINSYHHQVSGKVYAVDEYTLLLTEFNYDGNGADTFFWAGSSHRPGTQGFIVPDEYGKYVKLIHYDFCLCLRDFGYRNNIIFFF